MDAFLSAHGSSLGLRAAAIEASHREFGWLRLTLLSGMLNCASHSSWGPAVSTLKDLFPGNLGRMRLQRVGLRLGMPELAKMDVNQRLEPMLERRIRAALRQGADDTL